MSATARAHQSADASICCAHCPRNIRSKQIPLQIIQQRSIWPTPRTFNTRRSHPSPTPWTWVRRLPDTDPPEPIQRVPPRTNVHDLLRQWDIASRSRLLSDHRTMRPTVDGNMLGPDPVIGTSVCAACHSWAPRDNNWEILPTSAGLTAMVASCKSCWRSQIHCCISSTQLGTKSSRDLCRPALAPTTVVGPPECSNCLCNSTTIACSL